MNKKIFIDVTNYLNSQMTGIQRVTQSFAKEIGNSEHNYTVCFIKETKQFGLYTLNTVASDAQLHISELIFDSNICVSDMTSGDIFLDIDAVWNNKFARTSIYDTLSKNNVKICTLIHDILPLMHPNYFNETTLIRFMRFMVAVIKYKAHIFTLTTHVIKSIQNYFSIEQHCVIGFGCFERQITQEKDTSHYNIEEMKNYILCVGTIEPRKNYEYILRAYENIAKSTDLNLVIVGKMGWNCSELLKEITSNKLYRNRIFYMSHISDHLLDKMYTKAWACVQASIDEGLGLPIVEALQYKKLVFCSDIEVFREIGSEFCNYFDLSNPKSLSDIIENFYNNEDIFNDHMQIVNYYTADKWDIPAANFLKCIKGERIAQIALPKQALLLTANAEKAIATLNNISKYIIFIKEFLIICPNTVKQEIIFEYSGAQNISFITDEEILTINELSSLTDHAFKNFTLRCRVLKSGLLDSVFLATDDDYRALTNIDEEVFITNNKYNAYYFYKIEEWRGSPNHTSYDHGVKNTYNLLCKEAMPTYQFSSHMPQVMSKEIFSEALHYFGGLQDNAYSEWDVYFNYAINKHRTIFSIKKYRTLFWPLFPTDFEVTSFPDKILFENFYELNSILHIDAVNTYNSEVTKYDAMSYNEKISLYNKTFHENFYINKALKSIELLTNNDLGILNKFVLRLMNKRFTLHTPHILYFLCNKMNKYSLEINDDLSSILKELKISYKFNNDYSYFKEGHMCNIYETSQIYEINIYPPKVSGKYKLELSFHNNGVLVATSTFCAIVCNQEALRYE